MPLLPSSKTVRRRLGLDAPVRSRVRQQGTESGPFARLHPAQAVTLGFAAAVAVGTALLLLPVSAVCVTGLIVVDTATYWSTFGQAVILGLIQIGGFGIMTLASLLGLLVSRRLGLRTRLSTAAETKSVSLGDVRAVVLGVARISLVVETTVALVLATRLMVAYG